MNGRFGIVRKGYAPEEVDAYLDTVRDYLTKLEARQRSSQEEIDRLNKTLDEYRHKEASINSALVNSQISADSIMMNARNAADNIVKNAKNEAEITKEAINRLLSDIIVSLYPHRRAMQNFRNDYEALVSEYLKPIKDQDFDSVMDRIDSLEKYIGVLTGNE